MSDPKRTSKVTFAELPILCGSSHVIFSIMLTCPSEVCQFKRSKFCETESVAISGNTAWVRVIMATLGRLSLGTGCLPWSSQPLSTAQLGTVSAEMVEEVGRQEWNVTLLCSEHPPTVSYSLENQGLILSTLPFCRSLQGPSP